MQLIKHMKIFRWGLLVLFCVLLIGVGIVIGQKTNFGVTADQTAQSPTPQAQVMINKTFSFPVTNSQGQQVTAISYTILSAQKLNQIYIKGQKASAVPGRTFLVIEIKLTNTSSQAIQLSSRDYIRVSLEKSSELLAADLHSDPIIIQPISTEYTRIGFPMDAAQTHVLLHVGQLNGTKTDIPVTFAK